MTIPSSLAFLGLFAIRLCSMIFIVIVKFRNQIGAAYTAQTLLDASSLFGLVPEEVLSLGEFLAWCLGREDFLEGVRVVARIPRLGGVGHRRRREVLYLFEVEVEILSDDGEFGHIGLVAAWVGADEVGDDLLMESLFAVDAVEDALELVELLERGFAHESQYPVAGMLGGHLQTA